MTFGFWLKIQRRIQTQVSDFLFYTFACFCVEGWIQNKSQVKTHVRSAKMWKWVWGSIIDSLRFSRHAFWDNSGLFRCISASQVFLGNWNVCWDSAVLSENLSWVKYNYLFVESHADKNLLMLLNCMFWILPLVIVMWCILNLMLNKIPFLCWRGVNPDLTISDLGQLGEEEPAVTRCWCRDTCARTRRVLFAKEPLRARIWYLANIVPCFLLFLTARKHVGVQLCTAMRVWHLSVANVA